MKHIIFAIAFIGYSQCAKLDHLKYLPPDSRPTKPESFDQGLSAPKSAGFSPGSLPQRSYPGPGPSEGGSANTGPHGSISSFGAHQPSSDSQTASGPLSPSSYGIRQTQGSPKVNQPSSSYSGGTPSGYFSGSKPSGSGPISASFQGSSQPQGDVSRQEHSNTNQVSAGHSRGISSGYSFGSGPSASKSFSAAVQPSSQPHVGFGAQESPNGNQPSAGYSGGPSSEPHPSGSESFSASFQKSSQPQVGFGAQESPNGNQPSAGYSGGPSSEPHPSGSKSFSASFQKSSQPQVGFGGEGSLKAKHPSAGYSEKYASGPQISRSRSFGASLQKNGQPQVDLGMQALPNANQPSAGYSGRPSGGVHVGPSGSGSVSGFSQSSTFANTGSSPSVATSSQPSDFPQLQANSYGQSGALSAPSGSSQPASGYSGHSQYKYQSSPQNQIPIIRLDTKNYGDGTYSTLYETGNGIQAVEEGKTQGDTSVVQGAYSYTSPEGQKIGVSYTADENGYHPQGDNIPTPPPVPKAILKSIKYNEAHPEQERDDGSYTGENNVVSGRQNQNLDGKKQIPNSSRQYLAPRPGSAATNQFSGKSISGSITNNFPVPESSGTSPVSSGYSSPTFRGNSQQPFAKSGSSSFGSQSPASGQSKYYQSAGPFSGASSTDTHSLQPSGHSLTPSSSVEISVSQPSSSSSGKDFDSSGEHNNFSSSFKLTGSQAPGSNSVDSTLFSGHQGHAPGQFGSQAHENIPYNSNAFGALSPSSSQGYSSDQQAPQAQGNVPFGPSSTPSSPGGFQSPEGAKSSFGASSASSAPKRFQSQGGTASLLRGTDHTGKSPSLVPEAQGSADNSAHSGYHYSSPGAPFGASGSQQKGSTFVSGFSEVTSGRPGAQKGAGEFGPGFAKYHASPSKTPGVQAQDENGGYIY